MSKINWEPTDTEGVWIGEAREPGPTVGVIGGVHGDELAGSMVVGSMQSKFSLDCGSVTLMLGNIPALRLRQRFVQANLNRCFRELTAEELQMEPEELPLEVQRAQALRPYLDDCDSLLDLHEHQYPGGKPFIICEPNAIDTAKAIGAPVISTGWSACEPGGTDGYMYALGKEGLCYELGSKGEHVANKQMGQEVVTRFLGAKGLLEAQPAPLFEHPEILAVHETILRRNDRYELAREFECFEPLNEGEVIARDGNRTIYACEDEVIIFPDPDPKIGEEAFTIGRLVCG